MKGFNAQKKLKKIKKKKKKKKKKKPTTFSKRGFDAWFVLV
jgi:hypothetical protein